MTVALIPRLTKPLDSASDTASLEPESDEAGPTPLLELLERELGADRAARYADHDLPWEIWERALYQPLGDFLARPGKQFRARLCELSFELCGGGTVPRELPLLLEILHAGSLIVDDIEDNSSERRGAAALHVRYGLPRALNAGNWLYFWPFVLVQRLALAPLVELELQRAITSALFDCHRGQALDLSARVADLEQAHVPKVVAATARLKTGSLMALATRAGALVAGAGREEQETLAQFGAELGTALQMLDDLGGIASARRRHKGYEDLMQCRPSWPWAWLADTLDAGEFAALQQQARAVESRRAHPEELAAALRGRLLSYRTRVESELESALDALRPSFERSPAFAGLVSEIQRLVGSYE
ncbi:MAG TPA: polyprenyl synthetase family protein [Polyangiaceae bacterium]